MAEGEADSFTIAGSEFVYEFYCEFCNEEGHHKEAAGHCTECNEYFCSKCISFHKGNRLSRHHELLDKENMPRATPPSSNRIRKDITTICKQHKAKPVEYYCQTHDVLACSECIIEEHKSCTDTVNIVKTSSSIFNEQEYKDFIQKLRSLEKQAIDIGTKSRKQIATSERCCDEAIEAVRKFRDEIISILDDLETSLKKEAEAIKTKDVNKIETLENTCSIMQGTINKISSELESLKFDNRVCQAYIRIQETASDVEKIKQKLAEAEENNIIKTYTFVQNRELAEFLSRPDVMGLLSVENKVDKKDKSTTLVIKAVSSASFVQDINVRSTSGEKTCTISGSAMLSSNKLVLVDSSNAKIKLVDLISLNIACELKVNGYPWDVTVIKEDQVAVTVNNYNNNKILILKVTDTITEEREIKVSGLCLGIVYSKNQLVVTCVKSPYIEIMDLYGNVSSKVENDKDGNKLLKGPYYVCASSDGDTLYVSDNDAHKVVSLSRDGSVKAVYTDTNLKNPTKVCLDHRGNVYACGYNSKNIHMLTPDCKKIKVILTKTDGLTNYLYSISHCRETDRLIVGMWSDQIKVFQLS